MATILPPLTWENGFAEPAQTATWADKDNNLTENGEKSHHVIPPSDEPLTSTVHNSLGFNAIRTWPTIYNGTESPHGVPNWWRPSEEVDVLICGAGAFGLEMAVTLVRQGVIFRIIDKAESPLLAGRADAVHPRSLELLHSWGLAEEFHEEGPIMDHTASYKDGKQLFYGRTYQSDSRYRGIHIITQGQIERIYIRDLLRHQILVERCAFIDGFEVQNDSSTMHPVRATIKNTKTGRTDVVRAKFLVGADGAASSIRKQLKIPFDGISTDIFWAIMDCKFDTDHPYFTTFGVVMNSEHGGCIIVPREDGYTRQVKYHEVNAERAQTLTRKIHADPCSPTSGETGGRVDDHAMTVEEVLEQTNKIFAPWTVRFAAPLSWFAVWKISERVARSFSSPDLRVHLGGDAAHIHSVLGAFGLNSSIYDASNLGWKLGLCVQNRAQLSSLLPTYDCERRLFANRVIRASGAYLRFICNSRIPLAELRGLGDDLEIHSETLPLLDGTREADLKFLRVFFGRHDKFLLGLETPHTTSVICPAKAEHGPRTPVTVLNGRRAPNPRVSFKSDATGYLYDKLTGVARFHILIFGSDLRGPVRERIARFSQQALGSTGFFTKFGGSVMFNVVLVTKALPSETAKLLQPDDEKDELMHLREHATIVYDDRSPDEDGHYCYGINHARGAVVIVRPDLWVGVSAWPEEVDVPETYFAGFLVEQHVNRLGHGKLAGINSRGVGNHNAVNGLPKRTK
ncbi:hypothetical protein MMC07_006870 [Pseudocyphellaria aurata]|nr:hypothetical protein [Pseudocyphellaria aurata]